VAVKKYVERAFAYKPKLRLWEYRLDLGMKRSFGTL
jgi:hypothetical protein